MDRPVLRYFGGKYRLADWITSHFPEHKIYVEPFGGGASVLMSKNPVDIDVYNDLNSEIVSLFRVIRSSPNELKEILDNTPFSREEFNESYTPTSDPLEQARRTIVSSFMGFGGSGAARTSRSGFRSKDNSAGGHAIHSFNSYSQYLPCFAARLKNVILENRDAKEVMAMHDGPETLHYVDPPYVLDSRTSGASYKFEMTNEQHEELCVLLASLKGMVILSGYENELYESLGWQKRTSKALTNGGHERTETIWLNPAAVNNSKQAELFEVAN